MPFKRPARTPAKGRPTKRQRDSVSPPDSPEAETTVRGGRGRGRGRGGGGGGGGRGGKKKIAIEEEDDGRSNRRHRLLAEEMEEEEVEFREEGGYFVEDIWIPPRY